MNIGIDIDDTINDLLEIKFTYMQDYVVNILKREIHLEKLEIFTNTDKKYLEIMHGLNKYEMNEFLELYYEKMISEVKPKTLAVSTINKLKSDGNKIIIITTRHAIKGIDIYNITETWLNKNGIHFDKLFITDNKKQVVEQENVEIVIDDKYKLCSNMPSNVITFLFQSLKNYNIDLNDTNIKRVYSWPHVYQKIKQIENKKSNV